MHKFSFKGTIESYEFKNTTKDISKTMWKNIDFVTVTPDSKKEFHALYMVFGIGALISMLLLIIVIQLCKKSKTPNVSRRSSDDTKLNSESLTQGNRRDNSIIPEQNEDHTYRSIDIHYAEINESVEMNITNASTIPDDSGTQEALPRNSQMTDRCRIKTDDNSVDDITEGLRVDLDESNSYLEVVFVPGVPSNSKTKEDKVCINVKQI